MQWKNQSNVLFVCVLSILHFLTLSPICHAATVNVDIKANNSDGNVVIYEGEMLELSVSQQIDGEDVVEGDYWLLASTTEGLQYYYDIDSGWVQGAESTYHGVLLNFPLTIIFSYSSLPIGSYTFYFGTDKKIDGAINQDSLVYDSVSVDVISAPLLLGSTRENFATDRYILFAHGMGDNPGAWDNFAGIMKARGYNVLRTQVDRCGKIETRATELANYINGSNIPSGVKMKAIGHSMGGLDLRYIVGEASKDNEPFYSAAQKFSKVYTIATPHGGQFFADKLNIGACDTTSDARQDLSDSSMAVFNTNYPYTDFNVDGMLMAFLAFHFQCWTCANSDCVVGTSGQTWNGAPQYYTTLSGKHSNDLLDGYGGSGCTAELDNVEEVLNAIYNDPDYGYVKPENGIQVKLVSLRSGKCMDVGAFIESNNANIQQYDCGNNLPNQVFTIIATDPEGYFQLRAVHSGKCMDVLNVSNADGANIQQYTCANVDNQKFKFEETENGLFRIIAKHSGKCLDLTGGSLDNTANIQQYSCVDVDAQKWRLKETGSKFVKIISKRSGKVMDMTGSMDNGANIQQWDNASTLNQWFILARMRDEHNNYYYKIISQVSGKCFDVAGASMENRANVQQWECMDIDNQKFTIRSNGDGYYQIIAKHSNKCIDLTGGSSANGANIQQYECVNGEANQLWKMETR